MDNKTVPSGREAKIGDVVGTISTKQEESDIRKNDKSAPESDMTAVQGEGVARDEETTKLNRYTTKYLFLPFLPTCAHMHTWKYFLRLG